MVSYASLTRNDTVLEIGAGLGFLTRLLSQRSKKVIAIESDPRLIRVLRAKLKDLDNVELIKGDILRLSVPPFNKTVSNPPFYISSPILFWLLEKQFDCAVLTFQKEFAERLVAAVGSKEYGRLTVMTYWKADVELLDSVPKEAFYPTPDVDSYIVRLKPKPSPFFVKDEKIFSDLVRTLFTQRNKKMRKAIVPFLVGLGVKKENVMEIADSLPYTDKRVRELAPEDFGALTNEILKKKDTLQ
jgi:16S rRNA (adenine1518-N6/adenine1519-N6)-dimethyltransferase